MIGALSKSVENASVSAYFQNSRMLLVMTALLMRD